jgi:hypothetical protein
MSGGRLHDDVTQEPISEVPGQSCSDSSHARGSTRPRLAGASNDLAFSIPDIDGLRLEHHREFSIGKALVPTARSRRYTVLDWS